MIGGGGRITGYSRQTLPTALKSRADLLFM
jgi:hypothetical protein